MRKLVVFLVILLLSLMFVHSVFAVSYVDLERTTVGILDDRYALSFDGADYVEVSDSASLRNAGGDSRTLNFWLYLTVAEGVSGKLVWLLGVENEFYYYLAADGLFWARGVTATDNRDMSTQFYADNITDSWHMLTLIYDGTNLIEYLDAVEGSKWGLTGVFADNSVTLKFMFDFGIDSVFDEMQIYNRALNPTEIEYAYNSGNGRHFPLNETELVLWLHFNEGTGDTVYDETTNDNDGTIYGATWVTGKVPSYLPYITVTNLEPSYDVRLLDSFLSLITNATANSEGTVNLTLTESYLDLSFEGTYRIYDDNATFVYSKWFEDVRGGDEYEIREEAEIIALASIAFILAVVAICLIASKTKTD